MKNNTIVIACGGNYYWGAFLFISSVRKCGMDEPILVFEDGFTDADRTALSKFGDIQFVAAGTSKKNMTCRKPEAMLHASTDYITWCDCDAIFEGNCSDMLAPAAPDQVHARLRSLTDNASAFTRIGLYAPDEKPGPTPKVMLENWKKDVGERETPLLSTCVSACYASFHKSQRFFLERWRDQMAKVLPDKDKGVIDGGSQAYFQLDESVLNSLLCYMNDAPEVGKFQLDVIPGRKYVHFVSWPKPWQSWNSSSIRHHAKVMDIIQWSLDNGYIDRKLPWTLNPGFSWLHKLSTPWSYWWRIKRFVKRFLHS